MPLQAILREIQAIPKDQYQRLYQMICNFRQQLPIAQPKPRTPGLLQGTLSNTFFDPLPEDELQRWE